MTIQRHETGKRAHLGRIDENRGFRLRQEEHHPQDEKLIRSGNSPLHVAGIIEGRGLQQQVRYLGSGVHLLLATPSQDALDRRVYL